MKKFVLYCHIDPTVLIKNGYNPKLGPLTFTNTLGDSMVVDGVHHWAWSKNRIFLYPGKGYQTAALANEVLYAGGKAGTITISNFDSTKPTNKPTSYPTGAPTVSPTIAPFAMPCVSAAGWKITCPADPVAKAKVQPTVESASKCYESKGHSKAWGRFMLYCPLKKTALSKVGWGKPLVFTNQHGDSMVIDQVVRWAWGGHGMYAFPSKAAENLDLVNKVMYGGGQISISNKA
jgi:hypothetical protein